MSSDRPGEENSNGESGNLKNLELIATVWNWEHKFTYVKNIKVQFFNSDSIGNLNFVLVLWTAHDED